MYTTGRVQKREKTKCKNFQVLTQANLGSQFQSRKHNSIKRKTSNKKPFSPVTYVTNLDLL